MERMLVVSAHPGDVLWRCSGGIAKHVKAGGEVHVIALTYGLAGEAPDLLRRPGMTMEEAARIRKEELENGCKVLGASKVEIWGFEEYPLEITREQINRLAKEMREFQPDIVLTHHPKDDLNPDHGKLLKIVLDAIENANADGIYIEGTTPGFPRPALLCFEPHVSEGSGFVPNLFVDITDVWELKEKAMNCAPEKRAVINTYTDRAKVRGANAESYGRDGCKYAEAYWSVYPFVKTGEFLA